MFKLTGVLTISYFIFFGIASATEISLGEAKSNLCANCHGLDGNSVFPLNPNLAGQNAEYIVSQLKAFKSGRRKNSTMETISASLSNDEMIALATYYSTQAPNIIKGNPLLLEKGKDKYSLCWSCHGDKGEGPGSYPRLAGQHSQYTVLQLMNFKNNFRINPVMNVIVAELNNDDMEALGAYIATLNPQKGFINLGNNSAW